MGVRARDEVTVTDQTDATAIVEWYRLATSATRPAAPSTADASATPDGWTRAEPSYSGGSTSYLYTCLQTVWGDGTCDWGDVQLSSSYEAAKAAYNRAEAAAGTASRYVTELADGIVVHPYGDPTTGWSIRSALELIRGGASHLRAWMDGATAKVRVGLESAAHVVVGGGEMEVFDGGSTSVASFGETVRVGPEGAAHFTVGGQNVWMSDVDGGDFLRFEGVNLYAGENDSRPGLLVLDADNETLLGFDPAIDWDADGNEEWADGFEVRGAVHRLTLRKGFSDEDACILDVDGERVAVPGAVEADGNFRRYNRDVYVDNSANNGVTSNTYASCSVCGDDGRYYAQFGSQASPDGSVRAYLQARNISPDWSETTGSIGVRVAKDGTVGYVVTHPTAFRNAIGASSGVFPVSLGGTGHSAVQKTTAASSVITAASGVKVTTANRAVWGRVCQVHVYGTVSAAKSGTWEVGTLASAYRPAYDAAAQSSVAGNYAEITPAGVIRINGAVASGGTFWVLSTFLLA